MNSVAQITWKKTSYMKESSGRLIFCRILAYFGGHFENIDFLALCIKIPLGKGLKSILQA